PESGVPSRRPLFSVSRRFRSARLVQALPCLRFSVPLPHSPIAFRGARIVRGGGTPGEAPHQAGAGRLTPLRSPGQSIESRVGKGGEGRGMDTASAIWAAFPAIAAEALMILTITSMCYYALVVVAALVVSRGRRLRGTRPRASILVPLCGSQPSLHANLEAFRAALGPGDELL